MILVKELSNRIGVPSTWKKAGITSSKEHMRGRNILGNDTGKTSFIYRKSK